MTFLYGALTGAGFLALIQNLLDYRIDELVIEKVYDPYIKRFIVSPIAKLFGKKK